MTQMAPRVRLARLPFAVVALDRASTELAAATCSPPLVVFLGTCTLPELCKKMTRTGIGTNQRPKHWNKCDMRPVLFFLFLRHPTKAPTRVYRSAEIEQYWYKSQRLGFDTPIPKVGNAACAGAAPCIPGCGRGRELASDARAVRRGTGPSDPCACARQPWPWSGQVGARMPPRGLRRTRRAAAALDARASPRPGAGAHAIRDSDPAALAAWMQA